jgi:hypothetical protein
MKKKKPIQDDVDSFLSGIETSGSYGLKEVFKGDDKGAKVAKRGPMVKRKMSPPKIPKNNKGKKVESDSGPYDPAAIPGAFDPSESTGPLDPANIKGQQVKVKKGKDKKAKNMRKKSPKKPTAWMEHVKAFYEEKKKADPNYKYSQALKGAKATYKK